MENSGFQQMDVVATRAASLIPIETCPSVLIRPACLVSPPVHTTRVPVDGPHNGPFSSVIRVPEAKVTAIGSVGSSPKAEKPPLIDVKEFAAKLGCCPKHIRRMADSGRCPPSIQLGGLRRWNRQVVDDWIAEGCPVVRQVRIGGRK